MPDPENTTPPEALTKEAVAAMINGAMKSYGERIEKSIGASIGATIEAAMAKLAPAPAGDPAPGGTPPSLPPEIAQRFQQQELQIKKAAELLEKERGAREAAEAKQRKQEEAAMLQGALAEAKIRPEMMAPAMAYLGNRLVREEGNESVRWRGDDGAFAPVKDGVAEFLKTPVGKGFLPPIDTGGTGTRPGSGTVDPKTGKVVVSDADLGHMMLGLGGE